MRTALLSAAVLSLTSTFIQAEEAKPFEVPFPGLKAHIIASGEGAIPEQVSYEPSVSQVIDKPLKRESEDEPEVTRVLQTKIAGEKGASYFIDFDPGPSADPAYRIVEEKSGKQVGEISGDVLILPGNGFIYCVARTDVMHTERRKYELRDGKVAEVKQPFSYVGLESKAKVALTLTSGKGSGETVAKIPAGDSVQVVLRDGDYLLVKTAFGLVGWWKMKTDVQAADAEIEGIYYAGD